MLQWFRAGQGDTGGRDNLGDCYKNLGYNK